MEQSTEIIRSRQNRIVSEAAKLTDRKARERSRCFRFDGYKLLEEAVRSGLALEAVLLRESSREALLDRLSARCGSSALRGAERVLTVSDGIFDRISEEKSPEGVICIAKYIDKFQKIVTIYNDADFSAAGERALCGWLRRFDAPAGYSLCLCSQTSPNEEECRLIVRI